MKRESFYKITIAVLIALNLMQVVGRFMAHRPPQRDPIQMAIKNLGLDIEQEKQFRTLVQVQKSKMIDLRLKQSALTESFFDQPSESLLNEVMFIERKKIEFTQQHFIAVKNILKTEQLDAFEQFKKRSIKRVLGFPPGIKPHLNEQE